MKESILQLLGLILAYAIYRFIIKDSISFLRRKDPNLVVRKENQFLGNFSIHIIDNFTSSNSSSSNDTNPPLSPVCRFNPIRGVGLAGSTIQRILFIHMRKAGGTSLYYYFKKVAKRHNISLQVLEGKRPPSPETLDNSTLLITQIRDPIARLLSSYKYEMRWNCRDLMNQTAEQFNSTWNKTQMSLQTFVETPNRPVNEHKIAKLWYCSHNCFAKWSTGLCWKEEKQYNESDPCWSRGNETTHNTNSLLFMARQNFYAYNLILVLEWLKNKDYVHSIETMLGVVGLDKKRNMWCGKQAAAANEMYPLEISNETMNNISRYNQIDLLLYQELTQCPNFNFPNHSLFPTKETTITTSSSSSSSNTCWQWKHWFYDSVHSCWLILCLCVSIIV
jgi:hypothetical protein